MEIKPGKERSEDIRVMTDRFKVIGLISHNFVQLCFSIFPLLFIFFVLVYIPVVKIWWKLLICDSDWSLALYHAQLYLLTCLLMTFSLVSFSSPGLTCKYMHAQAHTYM